MPFGRYLPFQPRLTLLPAGSILNESPVFPQQDKSVLSVDAFGWGNEVSFFFKPGDHFSGGLPGRLSLLDVEFSHDVVKPRNAHLRIIRKFEHAPANCRLRNGSAVLSSFLVVLKEDIRVLCYILRILKHMFFIL